MKDFNQMSAAELDRERARRELRIKRLEGALRLISNEASVRLEQPGLGWIRELAESGLKDDP